MRLLPLVSALAFGATSHQPTSPTSYRSIEGFRNYEFESGNSISTALLEQDGRYAVQTETKRAREIYMERRYAQERLLETEFGWASTPNLPTLFDGVEESQMLDVDRILELIVGSGGPNCIQSGGGYAPPYAVCDGCMVANALQCIDDMRHNVSGNVATSCNMNDMLMDIQPGCCTKFSRDTTIDPDNPGARIIPKTSAYNDALLCLHNNGCHYRKGTISDEWKPVPFDSGTKNLYCAGNGGWPDKSGFVEGDDVKEISEESGVHDLAAHGGDEVENEGDCHNVYKNLESECLMHTTHNYCKTTCDPIPHDGSLPSENGADCACWQRGKDGLATTEDCAARAGTYDPWQCQYQKFCMGTGIDGVPEQVYYPLERNGKTYFGMPCNEIDQARALNGTTLSSCPRDETGKWIGVPHFCEIGPGGVWEYDLFTGLAIIPGINVPSGEVKFEYVNCIPNFDRCFPTQSKGVRLGMGIGMGGGWVVITIISWLVWF